MQDEVQLQHDPEHASEMAANAVIHYMHECDVEGENNKRQWLQKVFDTVTDREFSQ